MNVARRDVWIIFVLALVVRLALALPLMQPGYMDAYYYTVGAQQLASGRGLTEPFIWNYLDNPGSLPQPSHQYWLPLPSLLAALSMLIGGVNFRATQIPFVLLSAVLPVLAYAITWQLSSNRRHAWAAALFAIFSGFFLPFWSQPETFAPFAVFGSLCLWASSKDGRWRLIAGACAGLAHLTRADGVLLLVPALLAPMLRKNLLESALKITLPVILRPEGPKNLRDSSLAVLAQNDSAEFPNTLLPPSHQDTQGTKQLGVLVSWWLWVALGYMLVMSPWLIHNWTTTGHWLSIAGSKTIWLTHYDDLYSFGKSLDLSTYLAWGAGNILRSKLDGLWSNLLTLVAVDSLVFLAPFAALGFWIKRRKPVMQAVLIYGAALYLVMSLVFTFPGVRGGMFHSSTALLPFIFAAALVGLDAAIDWIAARRATWNPEAARRVFTWGLVAMAILMSGALYIPKLRDWNQADAIYQTIGGRLRNEPSAIVMVNNPPGYVYHTGQSAITVPNGDVETLLAAAKRFNATWVVLDANRPAPLADLYAQPKPEPRLILVETLADNAGRPVYLFKLKDGK